MAAMNNSTELKMDEFIVGEQQEVLDVSSIMDSYPIPNEKEPLVKKRTVQNFDEALDCQGVGLFHVVLILVAGWALASDSVEVQCVSFVTPQLDTNPDKALRPDNVSKLVQ